ncbi:hypothetical protein L3Q82_009268, partial [Scortum barcoo]
TPALHDLQLTSDPRTMDLRLQANPQLHYRVNGGAGRNPRLGEDDTLRFLSQEEQECLQFFEETIDSLQESLDENDPRTRQVNTSARSGGPVEEVDGAPTSNSNPRTIVSSLLARHPSPKDQDIIDLVRPQPDLVQTKQPIFDPANPDFQSMVQTPESHFEIKPRHDSLPSEYNPPLPSGSYGPTDSHSSHHPPGCIPTPVLIAQKIAENKAGAIANLHPTSFLQRSSLETDKPPSYSADSPVKQGPPTSAKPTRFPANINLVLGSKENQNQSPGNVNINERRAQMLANLSGSHPLLQEDPQQATEQMPRNAPTRSISFKDPAPDKSRMEALSKLGLARNRAMSGGMSLPSSSSLEPLTSAEAKPQEASVPPVIETSKLQRPPESNFTTPRQSQIHVNRKSGILRTDSLKSNEEKKPQTNSPPPAVTQSSYYPPPLENKASTPPVPEVTSPELNSYGGKSIVVHRSVSSKSERPTSPTSHEPKTLPPALANPSELNPYGGKTKVMNTAPVAMTRSDLPDILSSHIDKSQTLPVKSEPLPAELNSYGGKSRTINPSVGLNRPLESQAKSFKAPAPTPAPRPPRHSYHSTNTPQKTAEQALSHAHKPRSGSLFRPQGITVQFSGRGATDASRKEALRKLGLLKESF